MLSLELTTLTSSDKSRKLGLDITEDDLIEVRTAIIMGNVTHYNENPDNKRITNIHLTSGGCITSAVLFDDIRNFLASDREPKNPFTFNLDND